MYRYASRIIVDASYNFMKFECRLRFVKEDSDTEDVPIYTDSVSTYFMEPCEHFTNNLDRCCNNCVVF